MVEIKLRMQVLQAARRLSRVAHAEPCHWSEGCHNNVGVTAGKASHNASNARVSLRAICDATLVVFNKSDLHFPL